MPKSILEAKAHTANKPIYSFSEIVSILVRTRTEANLLLSELDLLLRSLYKTGSEDFDHVIQNSIRAKVAYIIIQAIQNQPKEELLMELKKNVESLNYIKLTIAFEPTQQNLERISIWIKQNIGLGLAVDLSVDKSILGGAIVEYSGKIKDFTILPQVNQYFS